MSAPFCHSRLMTSHFGAGYITVSAIEWVRPDQEADRIARACACSLGNRRRSSGRVPGDTRGVSGEACGLEQLLCGLEVGGGEPLGEAGVDWGQEVGRRRPPSLPLP